LLSISGRKYEKRKKRKKGFQLLVPGVDKIV